MAYYDAISNAIAARGNALAQSAQQQGQVYGNLASNLGQLPFQAMQAGQRRRALEVETQQRAAQTQTIQNELDFQKEAYATMNKPGLTPEQRDMEMGNVLKKFGKWEQAEAIRMRQEAGDRAKFDLLKGTPGNQLPPGGQLALPEPGRSSSVFGPGTFQPQGPVTQPEGMQNAFAPPTPIESQLVHREIPGLGAPPTEMQEHQQKVAKIKSLGLDPETEDLAIKALVVPAGILAAQARGSNSPQTALGITEWVSPDGTQKMYTQAMRNGLHVESGTGKVLDPGTLSGWTKIFHVAPQAIIDQQSNVNLVNKEEALRQMQKGGQLSATVPGIRAAETRTPLYNLATGTVAGDIGSRSGVSGIRGQGVGANIPTDPTAPSAPPVELGKGARSAAEQNARGALETSNVQLGKIMDIVKRRPELIGPKEYFTEGVIKRGSGQQTDEDANKLYNAIDRFKEEIGRAKEGAVFPPEMMDRLNRIVGGTPWHSIEQFSQDMENAKENLDIVRGVRGMAPTTPRAPAGGGGGAITPEQAAAELARRKQAAGKK